MWYVLCLFSQDSDVEQSVKPLILGTFGDLALALGLYLEKKKAANPLVHNFTSIYTLSVGLEFQPFLSSVLVALNGAAMAAAETVDNEDEDTIDFTNQLREGVLEAYAVLYRFFLLLFAHLRF